MLDVYTSIVGPALMERLTLLLNHVLASEAVATERLRPHSGRCVEIQLQGWPALLPPPPALAFRVTPAGLIEWCGAQAPLEAELRVALDASNPALSFVQGLTGQRPRVEIQGDAGFATDVNWLIDNLRWDLQDELAGLVGQPAAHELARVFAGLGGALRTALQGLSGVMGRARGGDPGAGPR